MMNTRFGIIFSLVMLAMIGGVGIATAAPAVTSDTQGMETISPYNGPIGPGNALYGLKIAFENLDESFTVNQSEKLEKQVSHADQRLAEVKRGLIDNVPAATDIALEQYWQKMNQTETALEPIPFNGTGDLPAVNDSGLMHAQTMIEKHQQVLEDLMESHPDNPGLERAYNNSLELEEKFAQKLEANHQSRQGGNNNTLTPADSNGPWQNQTIQDTGRRMSADGNITMPMERNQSGQMNGFEGNNTGNIPPGMNQTLNRGNMDRTGQGTNKTVQEPQQPPDQNGQANNTGNADNNQNVNNNANQNNNRNNNIVNPANGGSNQNTNSNRNTGSMNSGNTGNTRSPGR